MPPPDCLTWSMQGKGLAGGLSLLMIGAVLRPVVENWRKEPKDSFPLSYYPMFTAKRATRARVTYLVGFDARRRRYRIPYTYAGAGGLNQVRRQITRIVRRGKAEELCRLVASTIAQESGGPLADVVTVQVVTGEYQLADYFGGKKTPVSESVRASWSIGRDVS